MNLTKSDISKIRDIIQNSDRICIAGHKAPDGDCLGSVMALNELMKQLNKRADLYIEGKIPFNYRSFVDDDVLMKEYGGSIYDAAFILDCGDTKRLGIFGGAVENARLTVCIDHHKTNMSFADVNIIDPEKSSTGELLYDIMLAADYEITKKMAEYIYMAIITDTGKFSYSSTKGDTHRVAAKLIDIGVDVAEMDRVLYNSKPANVVKAYIECISSIRLYCGDKVGVAVITQDILRRNNVDMGDIDGVVEFIREIREVEVSCVLKENGPHETKVSLRSKNDVDVALISLKFGGGGHAKAAGFEIEDSIDNVREIIVKELETILCKK